MTETTTPPHGENRTFGFIDTTIALKGTRTEHGYVSTFGSYTIVSPPQKEAA